MMKKKIIILLLFIAFLFTLDRGVYFLCSWAFERLKTGELSTLNNTCRVQADIVILGSSRASHHYDTETLRKITGKSVFNAGVDGQGMPYICAGYDILMKAYNPQLIIIEMEPEFVISSLCRIYYNRVCMLAPYIDKSKVTKEIIYNLGSYQRVKYLSRTFRFNSFPLLFFRDIFNEDDTAYGFVPLDGTHVPTKSEHIIEEESPSFDLDSYPIKLLRNTIRSAKENGSDVILVTSPEWWDSFKSDCKYTKTCDFIERLAAEEQVPYFMIVQENYSQFRDELLFCDKRHLNRQGAKVFSEILASKLIEEGYIQ